MHPWLDWATEHINDSTRRSQLNFSVLSREPNNSTAASMNEVE